MSSLKTVLLLLSRTAVSYLRFSLLVVDADENVQFVNSDDRLVSNGSFIPTEMLYPDNMALGDDEA